MAARAALRGLIDACRDPDSVVAAALADGRSPIRVVGVDAPYGHLRHRGFHPIRLAPTAGDTPRADAIMGTKGLGRRGRSLLEALIAPRHSAVPILFTAADTETVQVFATVRELARLGEIAPAPIFLLDRLHRDRASSHDYNAAREAQLDAWLATLPKGTAVAAGTDAGDLADRLLALRETLPPRLSGKEALAVIAAEAVLPPDAYRAAASALLDDAEALAPKDGVRLFLAGSLHEDGDLYAAIEAQGVTIVGEDHGWGRRRLLGETIIPAPVEDPFTVASRVANDVRQLSATHVLHLTLSGDEAAPWQIAPLRKALPADTRFAALRATGDSEAFIGQFGAFLHGVEPKPAERPRKATAPRPARPTDDRSRSRKSLTSVADFSAYQRAWFADVRERIAKGAPFAVVNANAPQEILRALDIPFVVNQWWASIVAAKQQSRRYLGLLKGHDLPGDVEPYSAQGLAAAFDADAEQAPWGGLPKPDFLHAIGSSDATNGIFLNWSDAADAAPYVYERTVDARWPIPTDWWSDLPDHWDETLEPERVDALTAELSGVIARLEQATGQRFSAESFEAIMNLVNEQEEYYRRTRDLIARTVPAPIGIADSMPATMVPQWHRGTVWARDAAKAFHDEVAARVRDGAAAVPNERVRLMWVGRGLWSEMGFYQRWEESHGAVFVWSFYLGLAADGYIRRFDRGRDPLRALAARFLTMGDELRMPSWAAPWHVHEAKSHQVDGAVALADADPFVLRALERAGIPVLDLGVDNFNREGADGDAIDARITGFIEGPANAAAARRRGAA